MDADFVWRDGERLIRYGPHALSDADGLLAERRFAPYTLLTTPRALSFAPTLATHAAAVVEVPPGQVPDIAAAIRGRLERRALVALGGGRVVDVAKAIAAADGLACAAVPTTMSGAEMTGIHRLPAGVSGVATVRPSLVIAQPSLLASQPMPALAASAMNALGHAFEALFGPYANPVATDAGLRAARLIAQGLGPREPDRDALALGSVLAGYAIGATGLAVHHVVCQSIVRISGAPHAGVNAVMLPATVGMVERRLPDVVEAFRSVLGRDLDGLAALSGATRLGQLGVSPEIVPQVVDAIAGRAEELARTPRPPDRDELRALIESRL